MSSSEDGEDDPWHFDAKPQKKEEKKEELKATGSQGGKSNPFSQNVKAALDDLEDIEIIEKEKSVAVAKRHDTDDGLFVDDNFGDEEEDEYEGDDFEDDYHK